MSSAEKERYGYSPGGYPPVYDEVDESIIEPYDEWKDEQIMKAWEREIEESSSH